MKSASRKRKRSYFQPLLFPQNKRYLERIKGKSWWSLKVFAGEGKRLIFQMAAEAKGSGEYIIRRSGTFRNVYYTLCIQSFECERYNGLRYRLRHLIRFAARYTAAGIRDNDPRGSRGSCYLSLDNPCYRANFLSLTKFRYNLYERSRKYNKDR